MARDAEDHVDSMLLEEIDCPWSHSACNNVRHLVRRKIGRKDSGLVSWVRNDFTPENNPVFDGIQSKGWTMPEMFGDMVVIVCYCNLHNLTSCYYSYE